MDLMEQGIELLAGEFSADQAVADQFQVVSELIDRGVVERFRSRRSIGWDGIFRTLPPRI